MSVGDSCSGCVFVAASVGHRAHLYTYSWDTSLQDWLLLRKKKKVHGADWFPGPNMPVNIGRSCVLSCTGLSGLLGQRQTWGPWPFSTPSRHTV